MTKFIKKNFDNKVFQMDKLSFFFFFSDFQEMQPLIFKAIEDSDFVAFDGEFSGLRRNDVQQAFSIMDSVNERYIPSIDRFESSVCLIFLMY